MLFCRGSSRTTGVRAGVLRLSPRANERSGIRGTEQHHPNPFPAVIDRSRGPTSLGLPHGPCRVLLHPGRVGPAAGPRPVRARPHRRGGWTRRCQILATFARDDTTTPWARPPPALRGEQRARERFGDGKGVLSTGDILLAPFSEGAGKGRCVPRAPEPDTCNRARPPRPAVGRAEQRCRRCGVRAVACGVGGHESARIAAFSRLYSPTAAGMSSK